MGANETVATIISALAWPLVLVAALIIFRVSVRHLLARLTSFKAGTGEATFSDRLEELAERVEDPTEHAKVTIYSTGAIDEPISRSPGVEESQPEATKSQSEATNNSPRVDLVEIDRVASVSPAGAILAAWQQVERSLEQLYGEHTGYDRPGFVRRAPYLAKVEHLYRERIIGPSLFEYSRQLSRLRNAAVHGTEVLTAKDAVRFAELANDVIDELSNVTSEIDFARSYVRDVRDAVNRVCGNSGVVSEVPAHDGRDLDYVVNLALGDKPKPIHLEISYSSGIQRGTVAGIHRLLRESTSPRPVIVVSNQDLSRDILKKQIVEGIRSAEQVEFAEWRRPADDEALRNALNQVLVAINSTARL